MKRLTILPTVLIALLFSSFHVAESLNVYYGLLHAHTCFSDGSGTPEEAYKMAKGARLDFFAVTEHNHKDADGKAELKDGILIATNPLLYNGTEKISIARKFKLNGMQKTENLTVKPLIMAAKDATTNTFVALYGQEFSTISSGNHINVFGYDKVLTITNGNFKELYSTIAGVQQSVAPVLQFNHPDVKEDLFYKGSEQSTIKKMFNDYGISNSNFGPEFGNLIKHADNQVSLIEILSGPALSPQKPANFRYHAHENDYYFYLSQGFKVSPSAGQDNHYKTWGTITDARTGVYAKSLTYENIMDGLRKGRTFATEDKNMKIEFSVNGEAMGSSITLSAESDLEIKVLVSDKDNEGVTKIELYHGEVRAENCSLATNIGARDGLVGTLEKQSSGVYTMKERISTGNEEFYYVKIVQSDGDRAWTAPVYISSGAAVVEVVSIEPAPTFFWSKNASKYYHKAGCYVIKSIAEKNLKSGNTAPEGRTLHNCSEGNKPDEDE